jgi:hypothetical protein
MMPVQSMTRRGRKAKLSKDALAQIDAWTAMKQPERNAHSPYSDRWMAKRLGVSATTLLDAKLRRRAYAEE